ncbi:hypothetical protein DNHGIG_32010 [Collibacillus ludicampi]|uniref:Transposase n=1 Tax=Collibacillus ludicampi TaxID=2771369 RepID=A0AAV4LJU6_9BACL|nr:hypothetical protein DNHGIG_32010 [Collibacillus ludicampi]
MDDVFGHIRGNHVNGLTPNVGDEVWVHFVNEGSRNKYIPYKRGV